MSFQEKYACQLPLNCEFIFNLCNTGSFVIVTQRKNQVTFTRTQYLKPEFSRWWPNTVNTELSLLNAKKHSIYRWKFYTATILLSNLFRTALGYPDDITWLLLSTADPWTLPRSTYTQMFFNGKYYSIHNLQLVESMDVELWTLRPNWKDFPLHSGVSTFNPLGYKGQLYPLSRTLMSTEMIQRTSVILSKNPTINLF